VKNQFANCSNQLKKPTPWAGTLLKRVHSFWNKSRNSPVFAYTKIFINIFSSVQYRILFWRHPIHSIAKHYFSLRSILILSFHMWSPPFMVFSIKLHPFLIIMY
jgi:hypothetical protein